MDFLWFLLMGALAGWLAGRIMKGGGFGLVGDIVVGVVGGVLGGWIFGLLGLSTDGSKIGSLVTAVVGAIVLILIVRLLSKKKV